MQKQIAHKTYSSKEKNEAVDDVKFRRSTNGRGACKQWDMLWRINVKFDKIRAKWNENRWKRVKTVRVVRSSDTTMMKETKYAQMDK